jgi:hypothetical protein
MLNRGLSVADAMVQYSNMSRSSVPLTGTQGEVCMTEQDRLDAALAAAEFVRTAAGFAQVTTLDAAGFARRAP